MVKLNESVIRYVLGMPGAKFPWPASVDALARELDDLTLELRTSDRPQTEANPFGKYEFLFDATVDSTTESTILRWLWLYSLSIDDDKSKSRKWGVLFTHYLYGRGQVVYLEVYPHHGDYDKHSSRLRGNADLLAQALQKSYKGKDWAELLCAFIRVILATNKWISQAKELRPRSKNELLSSFADFEKCNEIAPGNFNIPFTALSIASYFKHRVVYQDWYDRLRKVNSQYYKDPDYDDDFTDFEQWLKEQQQ